MDRADDGSEHQSIVMTSIQDMAHGASDRPEMTVILWDNSSQSVFSNSI